MPLKNNVFSGCFRKLAGAFDNVTLIKILLMMHDFSSDFIDNLFSLPSTVHIEQTFSIISVVKHQYRRHGCFVSENALEQLKMFIQAVG